VKGDIKIFEKFRNDLKLLLVENSLEFRKVTLASGKESRYYIDCKRTTLHPQGLFLASFLLYKQLEQGEFPEAVGGPTLGADPLTAGMILQSQKEGHPLMGFIIRKEPKKHGTEAWIEGYENIPPQAKVALVEDVVTTAGSSLVAIEKLKAAGFQVQRVLCVVDREAGGKEALQEIGLTLEPLFLATELISLRNS